MTDNVMPFMPGVAAKPKVEAFLGRKLDVIQVSTKATLRDLQREYDLLACGLLAIPPLLEVPFIEHAEVSLKKQVALGFLETSYPITIGHHVVFGRPEFAKLDYQLMLLEKDSLSSLLMHLNMSAVTSPQLKGQHLHLRVKTLLLSDVLQAVNEPQRLPAVLPIPVVDVVGADAAWVYIVHTPRKLPQLSLGRVTVLTRTGPMTGPERDFARMLELFYAGDSDPYVAKSYVAKEARPIVPPLRGILGGPQDRGT